MRVAHKVDSLLHFSELSSPSSTHSNEKMLDAPPGVGTTINEGGTTIGDGDSETDDYSRSSSEGMVADDDDNVGAPSCSPQGGEGGGDEDLARQSFNRSEGAGEDVARGEHLNDTDGGGGGEGGEGGEPIMRQHSPLPKVGVLFHQTKQTCLVKLV